MVCVMTTVIVEEGPLWKLRDNENCENDTKLFFVNNKERVPSLIMIISLLLLFIYFSCFVYNLIEVKWERA